MELPGFVANIRVIRKHWNKYTIAIVLGFLFPLFSQAASLSLEPATLNKLVVGETFVVTVRIDSTTQPINAVSAELTYPVDTLELVSFDQSRSIFDVWAEPPTFSNVSGDIAFQGITLNPGYQGGNGELLAMTFRVRKVEQAPVRFVKGAILAHDGRGTNVADLFTGGVYNPTVEPRTPAIATPSESDADYRLPVTDAEQDAADNSVDGGPDDLLANKDLSVPVIIDYSMVIPVGDTLEVIGKTDPNTVVQAKLELPSGRTREQTLRSDNLGNFRLLYKDTQDQGQYRVVFALLDGQGHLGPASQTLTIRSTIEPGVMTKTFTYDRVLWVLILVVFLFLIGFFLYFLLVLRKLYKERRELKRAMRLLDQSQK